MTDRRWRPTRRAALLATAMAAIGAALGRPGSSLAQVANAGEIVQAVERYLNGLNNFKAHFTQIAQNGARSQGEVSVSRPGRLRFDYAPPSKLLLLAPGDWRLIYYNGSGKQVTVLPISQTPLGILLDDPIRLSGDIEVTGVADENNQIAVRVVRRQNRDQGSVTLVFLKNPFVLRGWSVVDPQGLTTQIVLDSLETNVAFDRTVFRWRDPKIFGYPED